MSTENHMLPENTLRGLRIGIITSIPYFLVTQLRQQILDLHGRGADIVTLTSNGSELAKIKWGARLTHVALQIRRRPSPWRDLVALFKMTWLFRRYGFQIVHSTTPKAGLLAALAGWFTGVPVRLHTFTGQPWVTMSGLLCWVSRLSDRVIARLNTRVYADSPSQRQFLIDQRIVRADKIGVIGSGSIAGVDILRFSQDRFTGLQRRELRNELDIATGATVVTFIGRITRDKGINELLQATRALHSEGHSFNVILIGPVDATLEAGHGFRSDTNREYPDESSNVRAIGYTDVPERYLAITDVLCLPSYREGFGTVVIEAAAMGVPTIGARITGLSDAVIDEVTGLLVPPRDSGALAAALRRIIVEPDLRRRLGEAARQRCLEHFDSNVVNRKLAEEYARLLSMTKSRVSYDHR